MTLSKKLLSAFIGTAVFGLFLVPSAFAVECDLDGDGYVGLSQDMLEVVVADNQYQHDGNYTPSVWANIFTTYKSNLASDPSISDDDKCDNINFKKGAEPTRCDQPQIEAISGVYDSSRVPSVAGNKVNPGAFEIADNGIDEDCDGSDGQFVPATAGAEKDLGSLGQRAISLLGKLVAVVSVAILIWGGVLYATAAGDENKTAKARKAIIGAIIGLIVGLLAPTIVNTIVGAIG